MIEKVRSREMFPTHMYKVDKQQMINGHYKRLMNVKSTIDNKTPKSFMKTSKNQIHKKTIDNNKRRLQMAVEKSFSTGLGPDEKLRLSRISNVSTREKPSQRPISTGTIELFSSPSLDGLYERRYLNSDVLIRHRRCFKEAGHHAPLINLNPIESKVRHDRNYYPPRRIQFGLEQMPLASSFKADLTWDHTYDTSVSPSHHPASRISFQPRLKPSVEPQSDRHLLEHEDALVINTSTNHSALPHTNIKDGELPYLKFVANVTKDILTSQVFTDHGIKAIFSSHLETNQNHLDDAKLKALLIKLLDDLGVEKGELFEDILMLPDEKQKRQWSPGQEYSKMSGSPAEDFDYSTISEAQSLSPDDIEDILRGKVNHLVRRLHQGQLKAYGEVEEPDENDSVESYDHEAVAKLLNRPVSSITELNEVEDGDNSRANSFEESWANDDTREDISEINSVVEELEKSDFEVPLENSFEESEVLQLAARKKQHQQQVMVVDTSKSGPGNSTDQKKKLPVTKPKVVEVEEELEEVSSVASEPLEDFDAKPIPDAEELRQRRASFLEQFQATQKQKKQMENLKILKKTEEETEEKAAEITRPVPSERRVRFTSHQEQSEEDFELSEESENSVISTQEMIPPIKAKRNSLQRSDTIEIKEISESLRDDLGKTTGSEGEEVCDLLEDSANPVPVPKLQENDAEDDESLETPKALRALRSALNRLALEDSD